MPGACARGMCQGHVPGVRAGGMGQGHVPGACASGMTLLKGFAEGILTKEVCLRNADQRGLLKEALLERFK